MDWHAARLAQSEPMNILVSRNDLQKGEKKQMAEQKKEIFNV